MTVTAVVIHRDRPERCLETVAALCRQPDIERLFVVDNGSADDAVRVVAAGLASDPRVELIELDHNTGFGPAANRGIERWLADPGLGDWCVVCPDDVQPAGDVIARLIEAGRDPAVGLMSADVGDGVSPVVDHAFGPISVPARSDEGFEPADYPHGTFLCARRTCLEEIGLFDERYFAYCEEADLGLRASKAGWSVGIVRGARVVNREVSSPTAVVEYLMERNTQLLVRDHFGRRKRALRAGIGLYELGRGLVQPSSRGPYWAPRARIRAIVDGLAGRWGPPPDDLR